MEGGDIREQRHQGSERTGSRDQGPSESACAPGAPNRRTFAYSSAPQKSSDGHKVGPTLPPTPLCPSPG